MPNRSGEGHAPDPELPRFGSLVPDRLKMRCAVPFFAVSLVAAGFLFWQALDEVRAALLNPGMPGARLAAPLFALLAVGIFTAGILSASRALRGNEIHSLSDGVSETRVRLGLRALMLGGVAFVVMVPAMMPGLFGADRWPQDRTGPLVDLEGGLLLAQIAVAAGAILWQAQARIRWTEDWVELRCGPIRRRRYWKDLTGVSRGRRAKVLTFAGAGRLGIGSSLEGYRMLVRMAEERLPHA
ncbi:hypothetical protein [Chachezhania sediminis]|uniref:hypothetical protein n=1 Tax=Chachezhania sediminis TaxID=2599291 RepID=UPI00131D43F5|nr:hypothetical protein [Chachezhania sediminis]